MDLDLRVLTCTFRVLDQWNHANLAAPYWRVYWNDRPGWEARFDGGKVALGPDHVVVIPPDTPYATANRNPAGHLYIHFVAGRPFETAQPAPLVWPLDPGWREVVTELAGLSGQGLEESPRGALLTHLLCFQALRHVPAAEWRESKIDPRVAAAMRSMELHSQNPVGNPSLAREAGMNTNAFIRLFHTHTGQSPQAWYIRHRIDYACRLLHHSRLPVKQIAAQTGFCDRAHFSRVFKRHRGMGPAEFRRRGAHGAQE